MAEDKTALKKAVDFLARREHGQQELRYKLSAKGFSEEEIESALQRLTEKDLQSDERFVESYIASRYQRGHGPYKITAELKQRGIDEHLISRLLYEEKYDWYEQAMQVYSKKYSDKPIVDINDKAKRSRFMQQRGFSAEHMQYVFEETGNR